MLHEHMLDQRLPTGETKREALHKVVESTGKRPKELDGPDLPPAMERTYGVFREISSFRSYGMSGPLPLSGVDIQAWCALTGDRLERWELEAIRALDRGLFKIIGKEEAEKDSVGEG